MVGHSLVLVKPPISFAKKLLFESNLYIHRLLHLLLLNESTVSIGSSYNVVHFYVCSIKRASPIGQFFPYQSQMRMTFLPNSPLMNTMQLLEKMRLW